MKNYYYVFLIVGLYLLPKFSAFGSSNTIAALESLGDFMQIYRAKKEKRPANDKVIVEPLQSGGFSVKISYWREVNNKNYADELCNAYVWVIFGRGEKMLDKESENKGALQAFSQHTSLQQIVLQFYDMDFGTTRGKKKGEYVPTEKMIPYVRVGVNRLSLQKKKISKEKVKALIEKKQCGEVAAMYLDDRWYDWAYIRKN